MQRKRFSMFLHISSWSVCLSSFCLPYSCSLLKLFDGFKCYLTGTPVRSNNTLCQMRALISRFGGSNNYTLASDLRKKMIHNSPHDTIEQRFRFFAKLFWFSFSKWLVTQSSLSRIIVPVTVYRWAPVQLAVRCWKTGRWWASLIHQLLKLQTAKSQSLTWTASRDRTSIVSFSSDPATSRWLYQWRI